MEGIDVRSDGDTQRPPDVALVGAEIEENLALRYLMAACTAAGKTSAVVPFASEDEVGTVLAAILALSPRAVGLSMTFQSRVREFVTLARLLREHGYRGHITAGGHFATLACQGLLRDAPWIDSVVRNEGEETLVELLRVLERASAPTSAELAAIPGLALRDDADGAVRLSPRRRLPPLDSLPWPDRSRPAARTLGVITATVVGSRGCYADCSFCSIQSFQAEALGPRFRQRSVEDIASEIEWLRRNRSVQVVNFNDDTFFVPSRRHNLARIRGLADAFRQRGLDDLALVLKCRPDDVAPEAFDELVRLGVIRVYVGIESASVEGLAALGRGITLDQNERALELLRERGVYHTFNLLLFDPDTTMESLAPNLELLERHADVPFNFCRTEIYVGTPLEARLSREGRLFGDYRAWGYSMPDPRAELMFRMAAVAFHQRNFTADGMAILNMGLRYDLEVLRHFYPGAYDLPLRDAAVEISRDVGLSTARRLREIHAFAARVGLDDDAAIRDATVGFARALHRDDFALLGRLKRVRTEIEARTHRPNAARRWRMHEPLATPPRHGTLGGPSALGLPENPIASRREDATFRTLENGSHER